MQSGCLSDLVSKMTLLADLCGTNQGLPVVSQRIRVSCIGQVSVYTCNEFNCGFVSVHAHKCTKILKTAKRVKIKRNANAFDSSLCLQIDIIQGAWQEGDSKSNHNDVALAMVQVNLVLLLLSREYRLSNSVSE